MIRLKTVILVGAITALSAGIGLGAVALFDAKPSTAKACLGGLASYSKDVEENGTTFQTRTGIDAKALQAKLDAETKRSNSSVTVTSTDPLVQTIGD